MTKKKAKALSTAISKQTGDLPWLLIWAQPAEPGKFGTGSIVNTLNSANANVKTLAKSVVEHYEQQSTAKPSVS